MRPSEYVAYFKMLAEEHVQLQHSDDHKTFYRGNIDEFLDGLIGFEGDGPFMFLEYKTGRLGDEGDNPWDHTRAAFMILLKVELNDAQDEENKMDTAWEIGNDILKRIYKETRDGEDHGNPFDDFKMKTVGYMKIGAMADREKGYRFEFDLPQGIDFTYDESKWISES